MNTMPHVAAMVALLWLSVDFGFGTLDEPAIGFAFLALFLLFIPLTFLALADDIKELLDRVKK